MSNNGQADMAMRSALFSHNATASEIRASLQNADARRRVVSGQQLPVTHKAFLDHHAAADARMSHDGISTAASASATSAANLPTRNVFSGRGDGDYQPLYPAAAAATAAADRSFLGYPLAQAELTNSGSQLHPINEHPEISDPSNEYRMQSLYHSPQQQQQQKQIQAELPQSMQSGGVRRNLFSKFKRVAKAVKTAAVTTSKSEIFRREAPDAKPGLYQYQPQLHQQPSSHFALYPVADGGGGSDSSKALAGGWAPEKPTSTPNPRHTLSVVTPIDDSGRILPFSQPGPRQRSLTQQPQAMSPITRVYSDNIAQSRSIEISRGLAPSDVAANNSNSSIGRNASTSSASMLADPNSRTAASHMHAAHDSQPSNVPSVGSPAHLKRKSPVVSHSSSVISSTSTASGPLSGYQTGAANRSYDMSGDLRRSISPISQPAALPHSARSADAIPSLMTAAAAATAANSSFPSVSAPNATVKKMSRSAFDIYPRRDRSMTLPSDANMIGSNSASNLSSSSGLSMPPPPLPPRSAPKSVVRLRSYSVMPQNQASCRQTAPQLPPVGTERLDLSISGSPLFDPIAVGDLGQSAGEHIHEQAIQNLSMADLLSGLVTKESASIGDLQLPPPAKVDSAEKTAESLTSASVAIRNIGSLGADAAGDASKVSTPSEVMVDPQYLSVMINSDKLKSYLKQVSDDEQKAEYRAMVSAIERREIANEQSRQDCIGLLQPAGSQPMEASQDGGKEPGSKTMGANNDSGVQVDDDYRGLGAMVFNSRSRSGRLKSSSDADTCTSASISASTSHLSLPAISASSSGHCASDILASSVGSPPSPFSFSHSRYSLINQDGSLNLASFQFDQLEGYQKQLSGSMGSLATQLGSLPQRSESKITERLSRRHQEGTGSSAAAGSAGGSGSGNGWFWSSLASSGDHRERSMSPPARSPRLAFGLSSGTGDRSDSFHAGDHAVRQTKLMRRVRRQQQHQSFAFGSSSASGDHLAAVVPAMAASSIGVFAYTGATSDGAGGAGGIHQQRVSESNSSCDGDRSSNSRRPSNSLAANPVYRRLSDNTSVDSQQSHMLLGHARLGVSSGSGNDYSPMRSNQYLDGGSSSRPLQRLMSLGTFGGETPFELVYRNSMASMSLEQALTLVEGTTDIEGGLQRNSQHTHRHRRLHKRSASALNANELDDIMIQTAEMCHSIQTAIRMQRASESGLGCWIHSVFGEQKVPGDQETEGAGNAGNGGVQATQTPSSGVGHGECADGRQSGSRDELAEESVDLAVSEASVAPALVPAAEPTLPILTEQVQAADGCAETHAPEDTLPSSDGQLAESNSGTVDVVQQGNAELFISGGEPRDVVAGMDPIEEEEESSDESSLDMWSGDISRRRCQQQQQQQQQQRHLGGDVSSDDSCSSSISNDSIGIQDPVAVVPSPGTLRTSSNCVSSSSYGPDAQK